MYSFVGVIGSISLLRQNSKRNFRLAGTSVSVLYCCCSRSDATYFAQANWRSSAESPITTYSLVETSIVANCAVLSAGTAGRWTKNFLGAKGSVFLAESRRELRKIYAPPLREEMLS